MQCLLGGAKYMPAGMRTTLAVHCPHLMRWVLGLEAVAFLCETLNPKTLMQGLHDMRNSLFTLLGPPRPLDATIRALEGKPLVQVCTWL